VVKCADCARLEGYYIEVWREYVYRCSKFRALRMRISENMRCEYFEANVKRANK
jgi:hypothetical protein